MSKLYDILIKLNNDIYENHNNGRNSLRAIKRTEDDIKRLFIESFPVEFGSDMNDDELINGIRSIYKWGIGTGKQLENGKIKRVDDREWEMVSTKLDQYEQTFTNRTIRNLRNKIKEL